MPPDHPMNRFTFARPIFFGLFIFAIYFLTLMPSLPGGDSGELIASVYTGGLAHPPGFPLYSLLAKLFTWIPFGNIAWRVNLFSAACSAVAGAVLFAAIQFRTRDLAATILGAGLFAFSTQIWRYSVVAEVFALNNVFVALLLHFCLRFREDKNVKWVYRAVFTFALGLSNHHILLFVGLPICVGLFLFTYKRVSLPKLVLLTLAGFVPYLYLPLASMNNPVITWGDASTWDGFVGHFLRRDFGTFKLGPFHSQSQFLPGLYHYLIQLPFETLLLGFLIAAFAVKQTVFSGRATPSRKERKSADQTLEDKRIEPLLFFAFCFYLIVFHFLANLPLDDPFHHRVHGRFWQQANLFIFLWIGIGFAELRRRFSANRYFKFQTGVVTAIALACVGIQMGKNWKSENQSSNRHFEVFGKRILASLPPNAILIAEGDLYRNLLNYLQACEGLRKDITFVDLSFLTHSWYPVHLKSHHPEIILPTSPSPVYRPSRQMGGFELQDLLDANFHRPIFIGDLDEIGGAIPSRLEESWTQNYAVSSQGLLYRVYRKHEAPSKFTTLALDHLALEGFDAQALYPYPAGSWEAVALDRYWHSRYERAKTLFEAGQTAPQSPEGRATLLEAAEILNTLTSQRSKPRPSLYKNLGMIYSLLSQQEPALKAKMVGAFQTYLSLIQPGADPDGPALQKLIMQ